MNRFLRYASLSLAAATLLCAALPLLIASVALPAAAIDDQAVDAANRAFEKAVAQDPVALEMQTDPVFTWVD